ncbi:MAG: outer membrane protein assembly factor BamE domain-containing protein [Thermodesulfobacteriota bacterium]
MRLKTFILISVFLFVSGCATIGKDFSSENISRIETGTTTKQDIQDMFGEPWRTGVENGSKTWTYGYYKYRSIGESSTKDLVVKFNKDGTVDSYNFNTTEPDKE